MSGPDGARKESASLPVAGASEPAGLPSALSRTAARTSRGVAWWLFVPAVGAALLGSLGTRLVAAEGPPLSGSLLYLAVGLVLGLTVAAIPRASLERGAVVGAWVGVVAVAATGLFGVATGGSSRWIRVGPLQIQVATLAMSWMALGVGRLGELGRSSHALALIGAGLGAISLTADLASALVFGAVALLVPAVSSPRAADSMEPIPVTVASRSGRLDPIRLAVVLAGVGLAGLRDPILAPVATSEGLLGLVSEHNAALGVASYVAMGMVALLPWVLFFGAKRRGQTGVAAVLVVTVGVLVPMVLGPWVPSVLPLFGYGGSALVATFVALGVAAALWGRSGAFERDRDQNV